MFGFRESPSSEPETRPTAATHKPAPTAFKNSRRSICVWNLLCLLNSTAGLPRKSLADFPATSLAGSHPERYHPSLFVSPEMMRMLPTTAMPIKYGHTIHGKWKKYLTMLW